MEQVDLLPTVAWLSLHSHPLDVQVGRNELQLPLSFQGTGLKWGTYKEKWNENDNGKTKKT